MPVIRDIRLSLKTDEVLRRQGLGRGTWIRPEIKTVIRESLATAKKTRLLEPAVAYEYYMVTSMNGSQISLEGDEAIHGPLLPTIFPEAKKLAVLLCTMGPKLGKTSNRLQKKWPDDAADDFGRRWQRRRGQTGFESARTCCH